MINHIEAALDAVGSVVGADNFFVLDQSVVATSVLFILYSAFMFGLCLWYCLLEAEVDVTGEGTVGSRVLGVVPDREGWPALRLGTLYHGGYNGRYRTAEDVSRRAVKAWKGGQQARRR